MSHRELSAVGVKVAFAHSGEPGGHRQVLRGVDLTVPRGRRLALLGANGSGKTTLLRVLSGAARPTAGQVRVDGSALSYSRAGLKAHRQAVQLVAQHPDDQLFASDVFRDVSFGPLNLGLGEAETRARVAHALDVLSIRDLEERPIHELSYGQRKRVAIAGALAMEPCVMLLDEPTAGLDPQGVDEMVEALEGLIADHTTVVISTHDQDFALWWADSVAILVDGQVHHGDPVTMLSDAALVGRARLRLPVIRRLVVDLDVDEGSGTAPVRDADGLVRAVLNRKNRYSCDPPDGSSDDRRAGQPR